MRGEYMRQPLGQPAEVVAPCRGNLRILSELAASGAIASETAETLSDTLAQYLSKENELKLGRRKALLPETAFAPEREAIQRLWREHLEHTSL